MNKELIMDVRVNNQEIEAILDVPKSVNITGPGQAGKSAYEVAVDNGFEGTEAEWLDSLVGPPGPKGEDSTIPGPAGADGENGVTFIPSVDANGNLSWTNDGGLTNPATVNIKGPKGDSSSGDVTAADVSFDDSLAGLSAGNPNAPIDTVQKAIEALAEDDIGSEQVQDMIDDSMPDMISPSLFALLDNCGTPVEVYNLNYGIDKFKLYGSVWSSYGMSNLNLKPLLNYEDILRAHVINNDMSITSFYDKITYPNNCLIIRISANNILAGTLSNLKKYLSIIKYDNTTSGLTATTLAGAIDELAARVAALEAK